MAPSEDAEGTALDGLLRHAASAPTRLALRASGREYDYAGLLRAAPGQAPLTVPSRSELTVLVDGQAQTALQQRITALARPALDAIGFDSAPGDDDRTRELRATLVRLLGTAGEDEATITAARGALDADDASLAAAALTVVVHHGDADDFDRVRAAWQDATDPVTETRNLRALAGFRSIEIIDRLLADIADGSVRTQDAPYVLARAMHNPTVGAHVWTFVRDNWDDLNERFPSNSITRMLEGITSLDADELVAEITAFLDAHPVPQAGKQVEQHQERQRINAALRRREASGLRAALLS